MPVQERVAARHAPIVNRVSCEDVCDDDAFMSSMKFIFILHLCGDVTGTTTTKTSRSVRYSETHPHSGAIII